MTTAKTPTSRETAKVQQTEDMREKVWDMVRDIKICTLVTQGPDGTMHARPMGALRKQHEGALWFFTKADSPKVQDVMANEAVLVTFADPSSETYVSLNGTAEVSHDRAKIRALWAEPMRVWFPMGQEDPTIALIRMVPEAAEYWDSPSSAFVIAYGYLKARLTGRTPQVGENEIVRMQ